MWMQLHWKNLVLIRDQSTFVNINHFNATDVTTIFKNTIPGGVIKFKRVARLCSQPPNGYIYTVMCVFMKHELVSLFSRPCAILKPGSALLSYLFLSLCRALISYTIVTFLVKLKLFVSRISKFEDEFICSVV